MSNHLRLFMRSVIFFFLFSFIQASYAVDQIFHDVEEPPKESANLGAPSLSLADQNYEQLREILPLYQNAVMHPWPVIPETRKKLKAGMKNPVVILLRERLKATHDLPEYYHRQDILFDKALAQAVRIFQRRNGLTADGVVGKMTLQELNIPASIRVNQIIINMQ